ncbi:(2Fe-2S)-binding protein [Thiohalophilus sp.]|uniref:(2Fe-2S)-binding protein n=1 Tax=Thiohalophilus sp. TaxID=3028392 RepID=UPI002ACE1E36|nr:(2Fe-2S)-binding protein [Thiohalophilus sp.]MDZ7805459.1 (2Fe-2S)-binding protein [Thiohalophilus sp.]
MYVCVCHAVTDRTIRKAVQNGADSFTELQQQTRVSTCCGRCRDCAKQVMDDALADQWAALEPVAAFG